MDMRENKPPHLLWKIIQQEKNFETDFCQGRRPMEIAHNEKSPFSKIHFE